MTLEDLTRTSSEYKQFKKDWEQYSEDWGFDEELINPDFFESAFYEKIFNFLINYKFIYNNQEDEQDLLIVIQELDWITNKKMKYEYFSNLKSFLAYYFNQ